MKIELTALLAFCLCWAAGCGDGKTVEQKAEAGDAEAQYLLGLRCATQHLRTGQGKSKEAAKWFRKAAEQALAEAQFELGLLYECGEGGVPQEAVTAFAWYNIAQVNGDAKAGEWKSAIAKEMTADQIAKAEALAKVMIKKNPKLLK